MPGTWNVSDLIATLDPDPWRKTSPFSPDMDECHRVLFNPALPRTEKISALSGWLAMNQPCLFGQMEAKQRRLDFCLLTENDLERSDQEIRAKIQRKRTEWKRNALAGGSHGFLIVAVSDTIANARPNQRLMELAKALCHLYLGVDELDKIHLDDVILEIPCRDPAEHRKWRVGVNYFSAQGDGRWWRDHRIPGGMAFSMNSVGHMARRQAEQEIQKNPKKTDRCGEVPREKLAYWALPTAMKTVGPPAEGSTRGTWLAERGNFPEDKEPPSFEQRERYFGVLAQFSENRYKGLYHTDETIPSPYFDETLWRREDLKERDDLYFTYLHSLADVDYWSMGIGQECDLGMGDEPMSENEIRSEQ